MSKSRECLECKKQWGKAHKPDCSKLSTKVPLGTHVVDLVDCMDGKELEEFRKSMEEIVRADHLKRCCPECLVVSGEEFVLRYVCALQSGDEEARGSSSLYQCPRCKFVVEKY